MQKTILALFILAVAFSASSAHNQIVPLVDHLLPSDAAFEDLSVVSANKETNEIALWGFDYDKSLGVISNVNIRKYNAGDRTPVGETSVPLNISTPKTPCFDASENGHVITYSSLTIGGITNLYAYLFSPQITAETDIKTFQLTTFLEEGNKIRITDHFTSRGNFYVIFKAEVNDTPSYFIQKVDPITSSTFNALSLDGKASIPLYADVICNQAHDVEVMTCIWKDEDEGVIRSSEIDLLAWSVRAQRDRVSDEKNVTYDATAVIPLPSEPLLIYTAFDSQSHSSYFVWQKATSEESGRLDLAADGTEIVETGYLPSDDNWYVITKTINGKNHSVTFDATYFVPKNYQVGNYNVANNEVSLQKVIFNDTDALYITEKAGDNKGVDGYLFKILNKTEFDILNYTENLEVTEEFFGSFNAEDAFEVTETYTYYGGAYYGEEYNETVTYDGVGGSWNASDEITYEVTETFTYGGSWNATDDLEITETVTTTYYGAGGSDLTEDDEFYGDERPEKTGKFGYTDDIYGKKVFAPYDSESADELYPPMTLEKPAIIGATA